MTGGDPAFLRELFEKEEASAEVIAAKDEREDSLKEGEENSGDRRMDEEDQN